MTTQRQIKKLLQPVLERHDDLELVGQWLYVKPVQHLARAVLIDRTSSADLFNPRWAIVNLCHPWDSFHLSWGEELYRPKNKPGLWLWSDPTMPTDLYSKIETEALPALRAVQTLHQFLDFSCERKERDRPTIKGHRLEMAVLNASLGNFRESLEACVLIHTTNNYYKRPEWREEYEAVTGCLYPLLEEADQSAIANLLRDWEAFTAEQFGITHIWEETPFPFEEE